jgi:hypothetical protein
MSMMLRLSLKPIQIDLRMERIDLYLKLREAFDWLSSVANDENIDIKTRLKAIQLLGYVAQTAIGMLSDEKMDELEELIEEVKRRREEIERRMAGGS